MTAYLGYSEGSRAATSIELGCADPEQPCKLPNAMAGDPPLEQVVTRTLDAGLRGEYHGFNWSTGVFRAANHDDILFVTSDQTGFGYFRNFGETRRQGIELSLNRRVGKLTVGAGYTYLNATFQSEETVNGEGNSSNDTAEDGEPGLEGLIEIEPGDRIPLIPAHTLKAYGDIQITSALAIDVNLIAASSLYARGNENNRHEPDDEYYLGPGTAAGYAIVNLGATWRLTKWLQLVGRINNLFDSRVFHCRPARSPGLHRRRIVHRAALPRKQRRVSPAPQHVLRTRRATPLLGGGTGHVLAPFLFVTTEGAEHAEGRYKTEFLLVASSSTAGASRRTLTRHALRHEIAKTAKIAKGFYLHAAAAFAKLTMTGLNADTSWDDVCAAGTARSAVGPPSGRETRERGWDAERFRVSHPLGDPDAGFAGVPAGVMYTRP